MNQVSTKPTLESSLLSEFKSQSKHLRGMEQSPAFKDEMLAIAQPYHDKLKEMAYPQEMSVLMLRKAFYEPLESDQCTGVSA